jgi:hypothetical protein
MNEMLFVFSHSEKVKYKGEPLSNFFLKGSLDDICLKWGLGGVQIIFCDSRRVKMLKIKEMLFVFSCM